MYSIHKNTWSKFIILNDTITLQQKYLAHHGNYIDKIQPPLRRIIQSYHKCNILTAGLAITSGKLHIVTDYNTLYKPLWVYSTNQKFVTNYSCMELFSKQEKTEKIYASEGFQTQFSFIISNVKN